MTKHERSAVFNFRARPSCRWLADFWMYARIGVSVAQQTKEAMKAQIVRWLGLSLFALSMLFAPRPKTLESSGPQWTGEISRPISL